VFICSNMAVAGEFTPALAKEDPSFWGHPIWGTHKKMTENDE
jgi:hypothetical protein